MELKNAVHDVNIPVLDKKARAARLRKRIFGSYELYIMLFLPILWYVVFCYIPMYGVQIAFKDFMANKGIWGSHWVGFKHFDRFFSSYYFWRLIGNTLGISLYSLAVGFPIPIILALLINEIRNKKFQKLVQNVTYMPHFLSIVVVVGMLNLFLTPKTGIVNNFIASMGGTPTAFLEKPELFKSLYVFSGVWQSMGWESIIYIAALAGVDPELFEAATIDGASRIQRIIHISLPSIMSTVIILFILRVGNLMNVGFEKVLLMQNSLNKESSDIIATFVYNVGIQQGDYSFSSAVGLFNSIINFTLLNITNWLSRRYSDTSLW